MRGQSLTNDGHGCLVGLAHACTLARAPPLNCPFAPSHWSIFIIGSEDSEGFGSDGCCHPTHNLPIPISRVESRVPPLFCRLAASRRHWVDCPLSIVPNLYPTRTRRRTHTSHIIASHNKLHGTPANTERIFLIF
jgi:hypothetical protein